jgi:glycosyltransferase involved in cell wall biosynthesis
MMAMTNKLISIVVPCYNEQRGLAQFCDALVAQLAHLKQYYREIILVNDGSKDMTWQQIAQIGTKYDIVR